MNRWFARRSKQPVCPSPRPIWKTAPPDGNNQFRSKLKNSRARSESVNHRLLDQLLAKRRLAARMLLGTRHIRTSGKGSGSIELTLPAELRDLVGLPCRIMLRDGSRPDIVLQPDMKGAIAGFAQLWRGLAGVLQGEQDAEPLRLGAFAFGLQPQTGRNEVPYLCWRDGLALALSPPHDPVAVSRTLAAFGQTLAAELGIAAELASGFGSACGYLTTGTPPTTDAQEMCDLAASSLLGLPRPGVTKLAELGGGDAMSEAFWSRAAPLVTAVTDLFLGWTADPSSLSNLRSAWQRGFAIEMSGD